jgi:hypothetical protein
MPRSPNTDIVFLTVRIALPELGANYLHHAPMLSDASEGQVHKASDLQRFTSEQSVWF